MKKRHLSLFGMLTLFTSFTTISCSFTAKEVAVPDIIKFSGTDSVVIADDATILRADIQITPNALPENREVIFTITRGTFEDGSRSATLLADTAGKVAAYVKSASPGEAVLTAEVQNIAVTKRLHFDSAYPHYLQVQVPQNSIEHGLNSTMDITVKLQRSIGNPTDGLWIVPEAVDSAGNVKAFFTSIEPSNSNDEAKAQLHLNDAQFRGRLFVNAYFTRSSSVISGQNVIVVE